MEQEKQVADETTEAVSTNVSTNTDNNTEAKVESTKETTPEGTVGAEEAKEIMIPKNRFDEVNTKYKETSGQVAELQKAKEAMEAELAELKKAAESKQTSITEKASELEGQVKQYQSLVNEMVDAKVKAIPEDMQELIPDGLSVEQKLAWLNKAEEKGIFKKPEKKQIEIGQMLNHSAEADKTEAMKKMNPLQLLASYYGSSK